MNALVSAFAAYDDDALGALGSPGLVRRARRLLESDEPIARPSERGAVITVGDASVRVDERGPASASCDCPVAGVCVHVLAASVWLRDRGPVEAEPVEAGRSSALSALDEILTLDPEAVQQAAGMTAVRRAARWSHDAPFATVSAAASAVSVTLPGETVEIRFVARAGFAGAVSAYPTAERTARHLWALERVFALHGRAWSWADGSGTGAPLSKEQQDALAETRRALAEPLRVGTSHLGPSAGRLLDTAAMTCRLSGLVLLARVVGRAASLAASVGARDDAVDERRLLEALADAWALTEALRTNAGDPERLDALRGRPRRRLVEGSALSLVLLEARWSGSRGGPRRLDLTVLDLEEDAPVGLATGRPAGVDPAFGRDRDAPLAWGTSIRRIASGPFRLEHPRFGVDGRLSASDSSSVLVDPGTILDERAVRGVAVTEWSSLGQASGPDAGSERLAEEGLARLFGVGADAAILLAPASTRAVDLDEVAQDLLWPLIDQRGEVLDTRVNLGGAPEETRGLVGRSDALLRVVESGVAVVAVAVRRRPGSQVVLDVSSVLVRDRERIRLVLLDFSADEDLRALESTDVVALAGLRRRLARWRTTPEARGVTSRTSTPRPVTATDRLRDRLLDVVDELTSSGRLALSPRQRSAAVALRQTALDLALAAVVDTLDELLEADPVAPGILLRATFIATHL